MSSYRYRRQGAGSGPHRKRYERTRYRPRPQRNQSSADFHPSEAYSYPDSYEWGTKGYSAPSHETKAPRNTRESLPPQQRAEVASPREKLEPPRTSTRRPRHRKNSTFQEMVPRARSYAPHSKTLFATISIVIVTLAGVVTYTLWPSSDNPAPPAGLEANEVTGNQSAVITPSAAEELFIPSIGLRAGFEDKPCRVKEGAINPSTMSKACTYTAADKPYVLPGTTAKDLVVIAGHTGAGAPGVFNKLYDGSGNRHTISLGDKLYLRTASSSNKWLVYVATDLHNPEKEGLPDDSNIWGTGPEPGRLLTISCIQPANPLQSSVRNAVVGWKLHGTSQSTNS